MADRQDPEHHTRHHGGERRDGQCAFVDPDGVQQRQIEGAGGRDRSRAGDGEHQAENGAGAAK